MVVENDGTKYVVQAADKMDKNHGIEDTELSNRGRMYATMGQFSYKIFPNLVALSTGQNTHIYRQGKIWCKTPQKQGFTAWNRFGSLNNYLEQQTNGIISVKVFK